MPKRKANPEAVARVVDRARNMPDWNEGDACRRFGTVFRRAVEDHRPQCINRRNGNAVVLMAADDFETLAQAVQGMVPRVDVVALFQRMVPRKP
jgi:prevent-host-death family protein